MPRLFSLKYVSALHCRKVKPNTDVTDYVEKFIKTDIVVRPPVLYKQLYN